MLIDVWGYEAWKPRSFRNSPAPAQEVLVEIAHAHSDSGLWWKRSNAVDASSWECKGYTDRHTLVAYTKLNL